MAVKCGIVGLPNVGKSTLFNALTKAGVAAENYPFCTIEPTWHRRGAHPRLHALAAIAKPDKVIPAAVEFVDIAGLVAGASKARDWGNQFLANIESAMRSHTSCVLLRIRTWSTSPAIDPISDIEVINTELALADPRDRRTSNSRSSESREGGRSKRGSKGSEAAGRRAGKNSSDTKPGAAVCADDLSAEEHTAIRRCSC